MRRTAIRELFGCLKAGDESLQGKKVTVCGWARTVRASNAIGFIELNDGSYFTSLQVVFENGKIDNYSEIAALNVGAAVCVEGEVVVTPNARQPFEIHASRIDVEGTSAPDYPLQKKKHSLEFLRSIAHLRARTNTFSAAFRIRSAAAYSIHKFFQERGFVYAHTPIISESI
ncbi:MAG: hypothetical protein II789_05615 [Clostridia bacterium]|nr:hypothetical protein [Clostridia bacterium]